MGAYGLVRTVIRQVSSEAPQARRAMAENGCRHDVHSVTATVDHGDIRGFRHDDACLTLWALPVQRPMVRCCLRLTGRSGGEIRRQWATVLRQAPPAAKRRHHPTRYLLLIIRTCARPIDIEASSSNLVRSRGFISRRSVSRGGDSCREAIRRPCTAHRGVAAESEAPCVVRDVSLSAKHGDGGPGVYSDRAVSSPLRLGARRAHSERALR